MIIFEKLTGWHDNSANQKYISVFSEALRAPGELKFLGGLNNKEILLPYLVDITKKGNAVVVSYYNHNDPAIIPNINSPEHQALDKTITDMWGNLYRKYGEQRDSFTIDLFNLCEVTPEDFNRYSPGADADKARICAFIITTEKQGFGFPKIYILEKRNEEICQAVWPLLGTASRFLGIPNGKPTPDGKYLAYLLLNGHFQNKFIGFAPNLASVELPTSASNKILPSYDMGEFDKILDNPKIDSLKVKGGKIIDEKPDEIIVPAFVNLEPGDGHLERIIKQITDKNTINLSDILEMGAEESLKLFTDDSRPVGVDLDIGGFAIKMCVFNKFFYAIPKADNESKEALQIEFGDTLIPCDMESFPAISK